jgi:hypothetical protein
MKIISLVQICVAAICIALLVSPSLIMVIYGLAGIFFGSFSYALCLLIIPVWWIGLQLWFEYCRIFDGLTTATQTRDIWLKSFVFNLIGLLIVVVYVSNGMQELSSWLLLVSTPSLFALFLASFALNLPEIRASHLER